MNHFPWGRVTKEEYDFTGDYTFHALNKAKVWCGENGFSYGSLSAPHQFVGLMQGEFLIAKWKNLTQKDKKTLDGVIWSDDFREGMCKVIIFEPLN